MTNEDIVLKIQQGATDRDYMELLCVQNKRLVYYVAKKYGNLAELEDLTQIGFIGLIKAAWDYKPDSGDAFSTYAINAMRWEIFRELNKTSSNIRLPEHMRAKVLAYTREVERAEKEHGQRLGDLLMCRRLDVSAKELETIKAAYRTANDISLFKKHSNDKGDDQELINAIADESQSYDDVIDSIFNDELAAVLWNEVDSLEEQRASVLRQRYKENKTLRECGESLNLSFERVRQVEANALNELRGGKHRSKLLPFLDDDRRSGGLVGVGYGNFNRTWTSSTERTAIFAIEGIE